MRIKNSTPKQDGYRMPGEFEPQDQVWMIWPERPDAWRNAAIPARESFVEVATAISKFTPVTMCVSSVQFNNARMMLPDYVRVIEMSNDDAWMRDCGPTFLINDKGGIRAVDWDFNAWGGLVDGLTFPWDMDQKVAQKVAEIERVDTYRTPGFVLEGGSVHVDGEGTVVTTEMCLLSEGRNPHMSKDEIEKKLCEYLSAEKVIWIKDGMDPEMTNGHVDLLMSFVKPGEVLCNWTDDQEHPFYHLCHDVCDTLLNATDAKGRSFKIHKVPLPKNIMEYPDNFEVEYNEDTIQFDEIESNCHACYLNFLITNGGIIVPQFNDEYDSLAIEAFKIAFPDKEIVGVHSAELCYGGGNVHCITQQQPRP